MNLGVKENKKLVNERQNNILKLLEETGSITLHELVNFCDVSEATIRRDLTTLEEKNLLYRTHGGAVKRSSARGSEESVAMKRSEYLAEKKETAKYINQSIIQSGQTIYLDAGTSTYELIGYLHDKRITVVTNSTYHLPKLINNIEICNGVNSTDIILEGEWRYSQEKINELIMAKEDFYISKLPFRPNHIKKGGQPKKMKNLLSIAHYGIATNEDATLESEHLFGNIDSFDNPKPELLISILIGAITNEGDLVLDSFLGSGTTCAVAHKMNRRYIGIEMGDHAYTHCKVRLDKVIDGSDQGGISKSVNWKGGGAYKFYELAPTLINKDDFGEYIINKEYDADMLASAVALHEGFSYEPDKTIFWKQSKGNENSYLFVTTRHLTSSYIDSIESTMEDGEYLIIACKSFESGIDKLYSNITIKKIPQMLLSRCEFDKENYNLNIINPPIYDYEEELEDE